MQTLYDFTQMWNLKKTKNKKQIDMNTQNKTKTNFQIWRTDWWLPQRKGSG